MRLEDGTGYISIEFSDRLYHDGEHLEVFLNFSIEGVGWGVVLDHYFSFKAIRAFSENLDRLIKGEEDEFHYSEDDPELIPKPFYWFDIKRKGAVFETHLKIHDCLDDYIEVTENVSAQKLKAFQKEFENALEGRGMGD
ncbi:MAG: hypothetical protein K6B72_02350 [Lachnospiraceae bacterium]|nr:hypothetical protein [Lachnospiraceae bacterium]